MKLFKALFFAAALALSQQMEAQKNVAYQDSNVRISIITDGAARLEYAPDGKFFDGRSFIAVNRDYPQASYRVKESGRKVVVTTPRMIITYLKGTGKFTPQNLTIASAGGRKAAVPFTWNLGVTDTLNLKGTYRTLDRYDGDENLNENRKKMPIENGLLSRSGWTLIDDSEGYVFDDSDWPWVTHRPEEGRSQDLYFMAYGHDYKTALKDYAAFAGKIPLPPRYAFGYWWSRYWHYTENEYHSLVNNMRTYGFPLDVLVIDMDWHYFTEGKGSWTGYTWNRRLIPNPEGFLKWAAGQGLKTTLNLHPAEGVRPYEEWYPQMAKYLGMNPDEKKDIPWEASNKRFMEGWFNTILHPMEKWGVSFWWLDWQQGLNDKEFPHLSNTWWINYCTFSDMERHRDTRPMLYHRWGGLGNHRYQIGFSGDAMISWKSLDFQPYFNSTASNVLYGYWSHDIGGHEGDAIDPELYQRWMQFGMLSPILRTHATKSSKLNKEPWVFSHDVTTNLREIVDFRYRIAPYIYTMARKAHDESIPLCRPMYYDYPESKEAYANANEYMFGDQMLFYPVTAPMKDGVATKNIWLPAGNDWFETVSGTMLKGGRTVERRFQIDEYPLYVKAGSVIPEYTGKLNNLQGNDYGITLAVYPGGNGAFTLYEDNGDDKNYETEYATTDLKSVRDGHKLTVIIGARKGSYQGMPTQRAFIVKLVASAVPEKVTVNGRKVDFAYDGNNLSVLVNVPELDAEVVKTVEVTFPADALDVTDGLIGKFRHIQQLNYRMIHDDAKLVFSEELGTMESTGLAIGYNPEQFAERIRLFRKNYAQLDEVLKKQGLNDEKRAQYLRKAY